MNKQKRISVILAVMFLFPWGMQFLMENFLSIYIHNLPYGTDKLIGQIQALGAIITMISQFLWTRLADKTGKTDKILVITLILLSVFSIPFLNLNISKTMLFISIILFYSCYMCHQPLIDAIASKEHEKTKFSFGFFRSFASLGFGLMGIVLVLFPSNSNNIFFVYVIILALSTAITTLFLPKSENGIGVQAAKEAKKKIKYSKEFYMYLVYTFILFVCSSTINTFLPVYYTSTDGLGGNLNTYSLILSIGTFVEWLLMLLFGKILKKPNFKYMFMLIAIITMLRGGLNFFAQSYHLATVSVFLVGVYSALLWASSTPYIKTVVPMENMASAQGLWIIASYGFGKFTGSYIGGIISESFGYRNLFLIVFAVATVLLLLCPVFFKKKPLHNIAVQN